MGRLDERLEVAHGVLLLAEHRPGHGAGGIVDGTHEREPWSSALEPVVLAAVDLEQDASLGHPLATAAVAAWPAASHRGEAGLGQDPAQRPRWYDDALAFLEQFGQVGSVHPLVGGRGQLHES